MTEIYKDYKIWMYGLILTLTIVAIYFLSPFVPILYDLILLGLILFTAMRVSKIKEGMDNVLTKGIKMIIEAVGNNAKGIKDVESAVKTNLRKIEELDGEIVKVQDSLSKLENEVYQLNEGK